MIDFNPLVADGYDEIKSHSRLMDWSDEDETTKLLKLALFTMISALLVVQFLPINILFLLGGLGLFLKNTAVFKAARVTFEPVVMRNIQANVDFAREALSNVSRASRNVNRECAVNIFENQRWFSGLGWVNHMLKSDRSLYSDETGMISKSDKDSYQLPGPDWVYACANFQEWVEPKWVLDLVWNSTLDRHGWLYSDHEWSKSSESNKASVDSLTRRRAWKRSMRLKT